MSLPRGAWVAASSALSAEARVILQYFFETRDERDEVRGWTNDQLVVELGIKKFSLVQALAELARAGFVRNHGRGKNGSAVRVVGWPSAPFRGNCISISGVTSPGEIAPQTRVGEEIGGRSPTGDRPAIGGGTEDRPSISTTAHAQDVVARDRGIHSPNSSSSNKDQLLSTARAALSDSSGSSALQSDAAQEGSQGAIADQGDADDGGTVEVAALGTTEALPPDWADVTAERCADELPGEDKTLAQRERVRVLLQQGRNLITADDLRRYAVKDWAVGLTWPQYHWRRGGQQALDVWGTKKLRYVAKKRLEKKEQRAAEDAAKQPPPPPQAPPALPPPVNDDKTKPASPSRPPMRLAIAAEDEDLGPTGLALMKAAATHGLDALQDADIKKLTKQLERAGSETLVAVGDRIPFADDTTNERGAA